MKNYQNIFFFSVKLMKSTRIAGYQRIVNMVNDANDVVEMNDADLQRPNILIISQEMTASIARRDYLLKNLRLGGTEIVRISTPIDSEFSEYEMRLFMNLIESSHVWGLNMGEFRASDSAWKVFASLLSKTIVGFVWINERGKDIGANRDVHDWLLGIGAHVDRGILRGKNSVLAENRKKKVLWSSKQPWYDASSFTMKSFLSRKFLFNPHNSKYFE